MISSLFAIHAMRNVWYTYDMKKTTVYLPAELKTTLKRLAQRRRCSEAEILREALTRLTEESEAPAPRLPLFRSSGPSIAEGVDQELPKGFGVR